MSVYPMTRCDSEADLSPLSHHRAPSPGGPVPFELMDSDHPESSEFKLPDEGGEDLASILAEMEAQQAVFDVNFRNGDVGRARALTQQALDLRSTPETVEARLTMFAMAFILGNRREDLAAVSPDPEGSWSHRTFEALAVGWMRWLSSGDDSVMQCIAGMHEGEEGSSEAEMLSLSFWAQAIEQLIHGHGEEAKMFFERATEVGSQFGTSTNPTICWAYAASFFPLSP